MWKLLPLWLAFILVGTELIGQQPGAAPGQDPSAQKSKDYSDSPIVKQMMAFNKKNDGKLTKEEVTDPAPPQALRAGGHQQGRRCHA